MAGGKTEILHSGTKLTSSWQWSSKYTVRGMANVGITVVNLAPGSGTQYTVRAYPMEGFPIVRSIASGSVTASGGSKYMTLSNAYDQIEVGVREASANSSGTGTVLVTGKRR